MHKSLQIPANSLLYIYFLDKKACVEIFLITDLFQVRQLLDEWNKFLKLAPEMQKSKK